jgi:hypothetical protein
MTRVVSVAVPGTVMTQLLPLVKAITVPPQALMPMNGCYLGFRCSDRNPATLSPPTGVAAVLAAGGSLTVSTAYYYEVTAVTPSGETAASTQVTATTTAGNLTINVSWTAVPGAASYRVYRSTTSGTFTSPALIGNPAASPFSDTGLALTAGAPPTTGTAATSINIGTTNQANDGYIQLKVGDPYLVIESSTNSVSLADFWVQPSGAGMILEVVLNTI